MQHSTKRGDWCTEKVQRAQEIMTELYKNRLILTWYRDKAEGWILRSGLWSPFYIQLRDLIGYPDLLKKTGQALGTLIQHEIPEANLLIGLAMTGIPLATAASLETGIPCAFTRVSTGSPKKYGQHRNLEGVIHKNTHGILIDDVLSSGTSKTAALELITKELETRGIKNYNIKHSLVLINRLTESKAQHNSLQHHSLIDLQDPQRQYFQNFLTPTEETVIQQYLQNPQDFQEAQKQKELKKLTLEKANKPKTQFQAKSPHFPQKTQDNRNSHTRHTQNMWLALVTLALEKFFCVLENIALL